MRSYAAILACLLLASCAKPPKSTEVGGLPAPGEWMTQVSTNEPITDRWWTSFGSTGMVFVVDEALRRNYDLKQALARIDAAAARARIAGADLSPRLDFAFNAARQQQVFVGLPIPGSGGRPLQSRATSFLGSFNMQWELDVWGRIRAGQSGALSDVQASREDYRAGLLSIAGQASKGWLAIVATERQLALARQTYASFATTATQIRDRYRRGLRSALDLRLALNNEAAAKALIPLREQELQIVTRQLEVLVSRYPAGTLLGDNSLPRVPGEIPAGIPSELLERRPDLAAAERRLAANLMRVKEAKRALLPRISLTASGGRSSSDLMDLASPEYNIWKLAGNFAQPLLQGGRLRANVKLTEARAREALEGYRLVVLQAFREVETTLESEQQLRQREIHQAEATKQARAAMRLAGERYFVGLTDAITLTETQRRAFTSESELISVHRQRLENRVDLHLALGGGFEEEMQRLASQRARREEQGTLKEAIEGTSPNGT